MGWVVILLLIFDFFDNLDLHPQDIIDKKKVFTKEQEKCINNTCDFFGERTAILTRIRSRSSDNLIGYFKCDYCEMLYSLSYFTGRSLSKWPRVIEYGSKFLDQLKSLVKENKSIYKIKELMNTHEITLIKLIFDLNLEYPYWEEWIKNNKRLKESIRLINDLLESDVSLSKEVLFAHYKDHFDYIRFYDRKNYEKIAKRLMLRGSK